MNIEARLRQLETHTNAQRDVPIIAREVELGKWHVRPSWATGLPDDALVSRDWLDAWPGPVIDVTMRPDAPHLETIGEAMARLGENWIELSRAERARGVIAFTRPDGTTVFQDARDVREEQKIGQSCFNKTNHQESYEN